MKRVTSRAGLVRVLAGVLVFAVGSGLSHVAGWSGPGQWGHAGVLVYFLGSGMAAGWLCPTGAPVVGITVVTISLGWGAAVVPFLMGPTAKSIALGFACGHGILTLVGELFVGLIRQYLDRRRAE